MSAPADASPRQQLERKLASIGAALRRARRERKSLRRPEAATRWPGPSAATRSLARRLGVVLDEGGPP